MEITRKNNISAFQMLLRLRRLISADKIAQIWWNSAFVLLILTAVGDSFTFMMIAALNTALATDYRLKNEKDKS